LNPGSGLFNHYRHQPENPSSLSYDEVTAICQSSSGHFWIGTPGGGLNRLDPDSGVFKRYTNQQGLCDNNICGIMEDKSGFLWISTKRGVSRFHPGTGYFKNYDNTISYAKNAFHQIEYKKKYREEAINAYSC
jgi:ligand-binding sensor domain-containing protein